MTSAADEKLNNEERDIDLLAIPGALWRSKGIILIWTLAALIVASIYLHIAKYTYTAELTVVPVQSSSNSITGRLGAVADLASMAGVSLPQDDASSRFQLYLQGVHSRAAADALVKRNDLMRVIYKSEWDDNTNQWREPDSLLRPLLNIFKRIAGVPIYDWGQPDGARLQIYLDKNVGIVQVPRQAIYTISFDHEDPQFAVTFLAALHHVVEVELRNQARAQAHQYIDYLTSTLPSVTNAEQRSSVIAALNDEEKELMMASSNSPFAAASFGRPSASFRPTRPDPVIVLAGATAAGFALGCFVVVLLLFRPSQFRMMDWRRAAWRRTLTDARNH